MSHIENVPTHFSFCFSTLPLFFEGCLSPVYHTRRSRQLPRIKLVLSCMCAPRPSSIPRDLIRLCRRGTLILIEPLAQISSTTVSQHNHTYHISIISYRTIQYSTVQYTTVPYITSVSKRRIPQSFQHVKKSTIILPRRSIRLPVSFAFALFFSSGKESFGLSPLSFSHDNGLRIVRATQSLLHTNSRIPNACAEDLTCHLLLVSTAAASSDY